MDKKAIDYASEYASILRDKIGTRLKQAILFGSQARGEGRKESDYDMFVLVDKRTPDVREAVLDADVEMMNRYETLFAALIYDEQEWRDASKSPLGWNIEQEGIPV